MKENVEREKLRVKYGRRGEKKQRDGGDGARLKDKEMATRNNETM